MGANEGRQWEWTCPRSRGTTESSSGSVGQTEPSPPGVSSKPRGGMEGTGFTLRNASHPATRATPLSVDAANSLQGGRRSGSLTNPEPPSSSHPCLVRAPSSSRSLPCSSPLPRPSPLSRPSPPRRLSPFPVRPPGPVRAASASESPAHNGRLTCAEFLRAVRRPLVLGVLPPQSRCKGPARPGRALPAPARP